MQISKIVNRFCQKIEYSTGKKLFGNTIGIKNNINGFIQMRNYSKKIPSDIINDQSVQDFRKNHIFIFQNIYDDSLINKIKTKYDTLIENEKYSYPTAEYDGKVYSRHIHQGEKHIPELEMLITKDISNLIRGYYSREFEIKTILLWRNYHIPKNLETRWPI